MAVPHADARQCRLKGNATETAKYCTVDVEWVLPAWSTPLKGINAVKQEVFSKPAPPLRQENLIAPFRVAPEMVEAPGTTVVVRDVKYMVVRREWNSVCLVSPLASACMRVRIAWWCRAMT